MTRQARRRPPVSNPVVYARRSLSFSTLEAPDSVVQPRLTRDARRFRTYFPGPEVLAP